VADGITVAADGTVVVANGTAVAADGAVVVANGTAVAEDGAALATEGTVVASEGLMIAAEGSVVAVDGTVVAAVVTAVASGGLVMTMDGTAVAADGSVVAADGTVVVAVSSAVAVDGTAVAADGRLQRGVKGKIIDWRVLCPSFKKTPCFESVVFKSTFMSKHWLNFRFFRGNKESSIAARASSGGHSVLFWLVSISSWEGLSCAGSRDSITSTPTAKLTSISVSAIDNDRSELLSILSSDPGITEMSG